MPTNIVSYGQHFMKNQYYLKKIVDLCNLSHKDVVMEIGAGDGRLTKIIASKCFKVISFEIDENLKNKLLSLGLKNVEFKFKNVLNYCGQFPQKIIANLPYQITEPFVKLLSNKKFEIASLLVGKVFAKTATKLTGTTLSIFCHAFFRSEFVEEVSPENFEPAPKVYSAIITLKPLNEQTLIATPNLYIFRYLFNHSKSKLKNALKEAFIDYFRIQGRTLTQNQSKKIIDKYFSNVNLDLRIESVNNKLCAQLFEILKNQEVYDFKV